MRTEATRRTPPQQIPGSRLSSFLRLSALAALSGLAALSAAAQTSYIPPISTTASTTLFSSGATAISPGRVAVDKAGNTFYINHVAPFSLYEIPAASPAVTNTAPVLLITALGQYNSNAVFVDPKGNLWVTNGNGSATIGAATEYIGLLEIPALNGIPNTGAIPAGGESVVTLAANNCIGTGTVPCVWQDNTFATNITNYYVQPSDIFVDGSGNVYFVEPYDGNTSGKNNRVISFNTATPGTGTLLADNLPSNPNAQVAVDGAGKVYYNDSTSGSGKGTVSLITAGVLTPVGVAPAPTVAAAAIASATGISADTYGNLFITSTTQISEVPFETAALNFNDEFVVASALTNNIAASGFIDSNGNYTYASATNVQKVSVNGYNFGSIPVGTLVTPASAVPAPTLTLYPNVAQSNIASYYITGSPTTATFAPDLQSFPFSGTKSFVGGTAFTVGQAGLTIAMDFQPVHPGLLKGSYTPRNNGVNVTVVNLQGTGTGPQAFFLPGIASSLFASANASSTSTTQVALKAPLGLAVDTFGDIFVADSGNGKVTASCLPTTTAGNAGTGGTTTNSFCGGTGYLGQVLELGNTFTTPAAIALDGANNLYVVDSATGIVTEIQGVNVAGSTLVAAAATFGGSPMSKPSGIAVDGYSNVYLSDTGNNRIVKAHQFGATATQNVVAVPATTLFGTTTLSRPQGLALDAAGDLFIADTGNNRIVEFSSTGVATVLSTTGITLNAPTGLAVLPSGTLVVTDAASNVSLIAAAGTGVALPIGTLAPVAPQGVAVDLAGNIYLSDTAANRVLELNTTSPTAAAFPSTLQGATSATNTTTLRNTGNVALALTTAATIDPGDANFTVLSTGTCTAASSLAPAATCTVQSAFTPKSSGPLAGTITVTDNQANYTLNTTTTNATGTFTAPGTQAILVSGTSVAGSGTTAQTITFPAPASPVTFANQTIPLAATATSGQPVVFAVTSGPGTISGNTLTVTGAGTIVVAANQPGNATYAPAPAVSQSIVVNQASQTITFPAPASPAMYSTTPIPLSATATSGQPVTFTVTSGPGTISGSSLTLTGTGTVVIAANQAGNTNYTAAPTVSQSVVVTQASQTTTFTPPPTPVVYGSGTITLTATVSSGLAPTFTITSGPGTINGSTLTITGAGTIVIAANQAGNANYAAAPTVSQSVVVTPAAQTITFTASTSPVVFGVAPVALTATATSGLAVTFSVISGPGTISGNTLTITGAGTIVIAANQAGNANYSAAPAVTQSIVVNAQPFAATPSITPAAGAIAYGTKVMLATGTTGAALYYTTDGSAPTTKSNLYTAPIIVTTSETISAIAVAAGYQNSPVATAVYTVAVPSFTIAVTPSPLVVTAGLSNTGVAVATPINSFTGTVLFTCAGLPAGATCTFTPSATSNNVIFSNLTVAVPAAKAANSIPSRPGSAGQLATGTAFAAALCLLGFRKRRRLPLFAAVVAAVIGLGLITGCGATPPAPSTAFTSSTITVTGVGTAAVGSLTYTSSTTFTLITQ